MFAAIVSGEVIPRPGGIPGHGRARRAVNLRALRPGAGRSAPSMSAESVAAAGLRLILTTLLSCPLSESFRWSGCCEGRRGPEDKQEELHDAPDKGMKKDLWYTG